MEAINPWRESREAWEGVTLRKKREVQGTPVQIKEGLQPDKSGEGLREGEAPTPGVR